MKSRRDGRKGGAKVKMRGGENKYNDTATHVSEPSIFCFHPESLVSIFLNLETRRIH